MIESRSWLGRDERDVREPQVDRVIEDVRAPQDHSDRDAADVGVLPLQNARRAVKICVEGKYTSNYVFTNKSLTPGCPSCETV